MFQNIVSDLSERLATIENLGFEALENSQTIYNDALSIYRKIYNLDSPNVETKYLTDKALSLSRDADRLKTDASTILAENEVDFKRISLGTNFSTIYISCFVATSRGDTKQQRKFVKTIEQSPVTTERGIGLSILNVKDHIHRAPISTIKHYHYIQPPYCQA